MTGWRVVHTAMTAAGVDGPYASPKGLRHAVGVAAVSAGIPLSLVQKWLGHAQLSTTAIYANAVGEEEQSIARGWGEHPRRGRDHRRRSLHERHALAFPLFAA
jgi:site-specific recombinase XerD